MLYRSQNTQDQQVQKATPLPKGKYEAVVTEASLRSFKDKQTGQALDQGKFILVKWQVIDGDFSGRSVTDILVVENKEAPEDTWLGWAKQTQARLDAMITMLDNPHIDSEAELVGIQAEIYVKNSINKTSGEAENSIGSVSYSGSGADDGDNNNDIEPSQPVTAETAEDDDFFEL